MTILEQLKELLKNRKGTVVLSSEIKQLMNEKYGSKIDSILLSDYCYNRFNKGISFDKHLFQYINKNSYKYLGEGFSYTGVIIHKSKGKTKEVIVGEWVNGSKEMYENIDSVSDENNDRRDLANLSRAQILKLYDDYNYILSLELNMLNCKATELRHLIGRIGEFYCVLQTKGHLASVTNQHGFDVILDNRRISVKTTAQKSGFISININTFDQFDDLFVVQYDNEEFTVVFYGKKEKIIEISRVYDSKYEVDLNKLKKLDLNKNIA